MRDLLSEVPKGSREEVMAWVSTIFSPPNKKAARETTRGVTAFLQGKFPEAAGLLAEAEEDVLAYTAFPSGHWRRIWSTNPLERLFREVGGATSALSPW